MDGEAERIKAEFDALIYAVSHDLRAPLRTLTGFSAALREEYGDAIKGEGERYLTHITTATDTLMRSIDGLLDIAHVARAELNPVQVDLVPLVREEVRRLQALAPHRRVDLVLPVALVVTADAALTRRAVQHLVDNAWKFTAPRDLAVIRLDARDYGGRPRVALSDNGVGFDAKHGSKLFRPFARLHGEEFPGVGIGLVVVQRILERHGGWIEVDSQLDQGTTVRFELG